MSNQERAVGSYMEGLGWVYDISKMAWRKFGLDGIEIAIQGDTTWLQDLRRGTFVSAGTIPDENGTGSRADGEADVKTTATLLKPDDAR